MNLIEIVHPAGALTEDDQAQLAAEIVSGFTGESEDAPEATLRRARAMTHVGFKELNTWFTGDGPWTENSPPPLWITMTVPEIWREELSRYAIGWLRRTVRRLDATHGWQRSSGALWINVVGIDDGSIGLDGKPSSADDVVATMSEDFRASLEAGDVQVPDGMLLDPMCGMLVKDVRGAILLNHDGKRFGFCAESCRAAFVRRRGLAVPA